MYELDSHEDYEYGLDIYLKKQKQTNNRYMTCNGHMNEIGTPTLNAGGVDYMGGSVGLV